MWCFRCYCSFLFLFKFVLILNFCISNSTLNKPVVRYVYCYFCIGVVLSMVLILQNITDIVIPRHHIPNVIIPVCKVHIPSNNSGIDNNVILNNNIWLSIFFIQAHNNDMCKAFSFSINVFIYI